MTLGMKRAAALGLLILPTLATFAAAQPAPDSTAKSDADANSKGRYQMSPIEGGVIRLDRETGAIVVCSRIGNELACRSIEERTNVPSADELAALRAENRQLKQRIKEMMEDIESEPRTSPYGSGPPGGPQGEFHGGPPGGNFQLPTDEEVDQALDYLTRVYKKIRDHVKDIDKDTAAPGQAPAPPAPLQQPPSAQPSTPTNPPPKLSP
ncbi:hypothetical protein [Hyphomicrobium sp. 99]|uniref:hypothetical protein n=1 Tax=Hyphomicrobium sp. 99 TaxID=1163419 RepID=UPI0005F79AAC|nr:hypothetical protein [Hyphomicrobium sp. 99]